MKRLLALSLVIGLNGLTVAQVQAEQRYKECSSGDYELHYSGCSWLDQRSEDPLRQYAVAAPGRENGHEVHVCRDPSAVPGKRVGANCYIPWAGKEYGHGRYQVLAAQPGLVEWEAINYRANEAQVQPGKLLIKSMNEGSYNAYICAVQDQHGNFMTGKYVGTYCWYPYGGHEYAVDPANHYDNRQVYVLWYKG
ncbi:DM9 repeat-containing protein [Thalassomonas haliotis]|uniref:DUF3421 domain-containing protein n=1 Tax=Thalassomonas haliotis TaxID=485448 RepID=A0ABY7V9W0_9GAMM|nr:DM9 repeat-containing protein [Thalassomonas haliotis]WDE10336.1 DUF3421 domain-containing protein [Thalassomonas haliotis]